MITIMHDAHIPVYPFGRNVDSVEKGYTLVSSSRGNVNAYDVKLIGMHNQWYIYCVRQLKIWVCVWKCLIIIVSYV